MHDFSPVQFGLIGSSAGNGHPYSWSAILNGYNRELLSSECPFPGIPKYLNSEPQSLYPHPLARVSHIFSEGDGGFSADHVAACTNIPHVANSPEELIGEVDAIIIATDRASEHIERCRPFVEAGLPIFVDKPLATDLGDLQQFRSWVDAGAPILSSSSMRYAREFIPFHNSPANLGQIRFVSATAPKGWDTYGIHALESIYPILGPGFESVQNTGTAERNIVHLTHASGADVVLGVCNDMLGGLGCVQLCGTQDSVQLRFEDTFFSFRTQLEAFIDFVRTRIRPFPFTETEELMRLIIGAKMSLERGGTKIRLAQ